LVSFTVLGQKQELTHTNTDFKIKLSKQLSSKYSEFAPRFVDNTYTRIIFTSSKQANEDKLTNLYYTELHNGKWGKTIPLISDDNKVGSGVITIDTKRKVMFFTKCPFKMMEKGMQCNIYYSFLEGALIGEAIPLNIPIDLGNIEGLVNIGHPSFSNENDILFFAADLPGGYGSKDIWFSKYDRKTDAWSEPKNAGPEINTSENELYPFIHVDGTLYFSSGGHEGLGGWDIFKAEKTGELSWSNVQNLGSPVNSSSDDFAIVFKGKSLSGFLSSNRKGGLGSDDIYEFTTVKTLDYDEQVLSSDSVDSPIQAISAVFNKEECVENTESLKVSDAKIYPNPNNGQFTLEFSSNKKTDLKIRIHSNLGQLLLTEEISVTKENFKREFELNNASKGVYYIQILHECEILSIHKMIIN